MRKGFTLIELMVVVTIIAVLLALMLPALENSIYQAELATCGGNFKGMGIALVVYASDNKRYYPTRVAATHTANFIPGNQAMFNKLFPVNKMLNDPFGPKVDLETTKSGAIYASQHLYFSFKYTGEKGVNRIGDSLQWKGVSLNILAADQDQILPNWCTSGHPDIEGVMYPTAAQDSEEPFLTPLPADLGTTTGTSGFATYAWWKTPSGKRGPVDYNYLYGDLSVRRVNRVKWNDDRMYSMPFYASGAEPTGGPTAYGSGSFTLLPK